jgi:hypothetical protein
MSALREAAQQALEALEAMQSYAAAERKGLLICDESIIALRAALEQPEQEPVAWQWLNTAHFRKKLPADAELRAWNPLFTHPPRREWRGLTDKEIRDLWSWSATVEAERTATTQQHAFARAIEAALKERNA